MFARPCAHQTDCSRSPALPRGTTKSAILLAVLSWACGDDSAMGGAGPGGGIGGGGAAPIGGTGGTAGADCIGSAEPCLEGPACQDRCCSGFVITGQGDPICG